MCIRDRSYTFREGVNLGNIIPRTRLHAGIFIVAVFVVLTYIFMFKTKWGYKLRMTGSNIHFAKCAGIGVAGVIMSAQLIGGFIAGVGGGTEMLGMYSRFQWSALPGYGFDGVILNILAKENPAYIPVAAFFVAYLRIGADYMYKQSDVCLLYTSGAVHGSGRIRRAAGLPVCLRISQIRICQEGAGG